MRISDRNTHQKIASCLPVFRSPGTNDASFLQQIFSCGSLQELGGIQLHSLPQWIFIIQFARKI